jgi:hypothetical protein
MKKYRLVLSGLSLLVFFSTAWGQVGLPKEMVEYYMAYNLVNAFSLPFERQFLVRSNFDVSKDAYDEQTRDRLNRISGLMKQIAVATIGVDPKMIILHPKTDQKRTIEFSALHPLISNSEVFRIVSFAKGPDTLSVRVLALSLPAEINQRLVGAFPETTTRPDDTELQRQLSRLNLRPLSRQEIHTWVRLPEGWRKKEINTALLSD